jgi:rhodanese-related sulfurtransferase
VLAVVSQLPGKSEIINHRIAEAERQKKCVFKEMSADKLAYEITNNYYKLNVIDVRPKEEYEKYHLPMAINIPFEEIMNREWEYIFKQRIRSNVFYANSDTLVRMSCLKAKYIGKSDNFILREKADEFRNMFFNLKEPVATASKEEHEIYHYRNQSAIQMNNLMESLQNIGKPVKKEIKKVKGGCS